MYTVNIQGQNMDVVIDGKIFGEWMMDGKLDGCVWMMEC